MPTKPKQKTKSGVYKVERLEAQVSSKEKNIFARAIQNYETMKLANQDRKAFINALLNPPEPSDNLKAAAKRYFKRG